MELPALKRFAIVASICISVAGSVRAHSATMEGISMRVQPAGKLFEGAFFSIRYPAGFIATGGMRSASSERGYDSATFSSKDGSIAFYVFSPQWSGVAKDIALKSGERKLAEEKAKAGDTAIVSYTIVGRRGSYRRSYEKRHDNVSGTDLVFGIVYKNTAILKAYRGKYLKFKHSLVQYADH